MQLGSILDQTQAIRVTGRVREITGLTVIAEGLVLPIGHMCRIHRRDLPPVAAQIVGARDDHAILMTLQEPAGIRVGDAVQSSAGMQNVAVGRQMLGCVVNGLGQIIGGKRDFPIEAHYPVFASAPPALGRRAIDAPLPTGIRVIDAMHTIGKGQRVGIFAGTGVGKTVLMGMVTRYTAADVVVVALVGERGREVGDFLRKELGDEGLKRCVLVVSTSDESPVLRVRAAFVATAIAEFFRDSGSEVLLMVDSTTRIAMAQREVGLSAGEPPTTKGYPPSAFSLFPKLLERSGRTQSGSITGIYTVLVEGDDITEPVSDATRGVLDGHLWLSRSLANRAHYPAISVLESISRIMPDLVDGEHQKSANQVRRTLAIWHDIEDLVNVGAYAPGANADFDVAVQMKPRIDAFLQQAVMEQADYADTRGRLVALAREIVSLRESIRSKTR
jgi:flagellum-specific ATP synthase